jgi:transposase-like protein
VPAPHPPEFRARAVELARLRERPVREIAQSLGISESCPQNWMSQADFDTGDKPGLTSDERRELAELRRDKRRLELENGILTRAARVLREASHEVCPGQRAGRRSRRWRVGREPGEGEVVQGRLSCGPPRLRRWRVRWPLLASSGLVPASAANRCGHRKPTQSRSACTLGQAAPLRALLLQPTTTEIHPVRRHHRVGGLLHEYQQVA